MKKKIGVLVIIIVLLIIAIVIFNSRKDENETQTSFYNETEGQYYIYNSNGELVKTTEDQAEYEFYMRNPDYEAGLENVAEPGAIETNILVEN